MAERDDKLRIKIYVSNIPRSLWGYASFKRHFERFGNIETCFLDQNRRFGHVTFYNHEDAERAFNEAADCGNGWKLVIQWWRGNRSNYVNRGSNTLTKTSKIGQRGRNFEQSNLKRHMTRDGATTSHVDSQQTANDFRDTYVDIEVFSPLYWKNVISLPGPEDTRCLLALNIEESLRYQTIKMHFQNKVKSGGGPVGNIYRLTDGLLVVFKYAKDCESALAKKNQVLGGREILTFQKIIPRYYENRFIVSESNDQNRTSMETLQLYLENCSEKETSPSLCRKTDYPGVYYVTYRNDFDKSETEKLLKNINSRPLEGRKMKASKLLRTDCLKVTNLHGRISDHVIQMYFENKKRSSGGPVTKVDRLRDNIALVYFGSYKDAENIVGGFNSLVSTSLVIQRQKVYVHLYFHSLEKIHERKNTTASLRYTSRDQHHKQGESVPKYQSSIRTFCDSIKLDDKILQLICNSKKHSGQLKISVTFAVLEFIKEGDVVTHLRFISKKAEPQRDFETACQSQVQDFVKNYEAFTEEFDEDILKKGRLIKICPEISESFTGNDDVAISWTNNKVEVIGLKQSAKEMLEYITERLNLSTVNMKIKAGQFDILSHLGILEEVKMNYKNVLVQYKFDTKTITLTGPELDVAKFQTDSLIHLNMLPKVRLIWRDINLNSYFLTTMRREPSIISTIQEAFKQSGLNATLLIEGQEVSITGTKIEYCQRAETIVKELFKIATIPVNDWTSISSRNLFVFMKDMRLKNMIWVEETMQIIHLIIRIAKNGPR